MGAAAAVLTWFAGPRLGLALLAGLVVAAGLVALDWLRARHRRLSADVAAVRAELLGREHFDAAQRRAGEQRAKQLETVERRLGSARRQDFAQLQALLNLYAMVPVRDRMPASRTGWTAGPDLLLLLVSIVRAQRPTTVVDLGSGVSTVWLALAMREFGIDGRVVALDHEAGYADATREAVSALGLGKLAEVRHAPLDDLDLAGDTFPWYERSSLDDVVSCDLLFVDGPPGVLRHHSRYPALPVLGARMTVGGHVVVDDYAREDERDMVARWVAASPEWSLRELPLEKGAALLTRTA
jgi:predicted O-methyltransferase YrrM